MPASGGMELSFDMGGGSAKPKRKGPPSALQKRLAAGGSKPAATKAASPAVRGRRSSMQMGGAAGSAGKPPIRRPGSGTGVRSRPGSASRERANSDGGAAASGSFRLSQKVECNWKGRGRWMPGRVVSSNPDGTYDCKFDDGDEERRVPADRLREVGGSGAASSSRGGGGGGDPSTTAGGSNQSRA